jgi:RNA polymerase sigma factor (sigma-70 family)
MDEATSALDTISEAKIYDNLKKRIEHKTVILISHRISTLKNADKIHVISDNRVAESGTFDELLAKQGAFYEFYRASAREGGKELAEELEIRKKMVQYEKKRAEAKKALKLTPLEKQVMKLYYEAGESYAKIAQELGIPPYDVSLIRKAASDKLKRLRELEVEE